MFKEAGVLFLFTETPLHAGSGNGSGAVDLPIQRERHTHYPLIQAPGVKGPLRDLAEHRHGIHQVKAELRQMREQKDPPPTEDEIAQKRQELYEKLCPIEVVFGPDPDSNRASDHGGALSFTDARILLFPVRSLTGVFAWITCPTAIARFLRDLRALKGSSPDVAGLKPRNPATNSDAFITTSCCVEHDGVMVFEDFAFQPEGGKKPTEEQIQYREDVTKFAAWLATNALPQDSANDFWTTKLKTSLVLVHDDAFRDFVLFSTEVIPRVRIDETGTVKDGAFWYEEHLPSDCLLYSLALAADPKANAEKTKQAEIEDASAVLDFLQKKLNGHGREAGIVSFGGDTTVGRGIVQIRFLPEPLSAPSTSSSQSNTTENGGSHVDASND